MKTFRAWLIKKETTELDLTKDIGDDLSAIQQPGSQPNYPPASVAGLVVRKLPKVAMALVDPNQPFAKQIAAMQKNMPQSPSPPIAPMAATPAPIR